ncbi:MAG: 4'-phosphopantetheinyl transferase superfamily protein [Christensenellaceae bacterium]
MQKIYLLDIKDFSDEEPLKSILPPYAISKAEGYANKADRLRSLFGSMLIERFTAEKPLFFGAHGKPYKKSPPFFNVSHSGNKVGIFLSDKTEVGFDVQLIKPQSERLKNHIFSSEERQFINTDTDFAKFWTMKEAAGKCVGTGIIALRKNPLTEITDNSFVFKTEKFYYKTFILDGYAVCACSTEQVRAEFLPISVEFVLKTLAN